MGSFVNFFDGYTTDSVPIITQVDRLQPFANDAAFEAAIDGAPIPGNIYYNTTEERIRYYTADHWDYVPDGITFEALQTLVNNHIAATSAHGTTGNVVGDTDLQTLTNKTIDSVNNTLTIDADNATISNLEVDNLKSGVLETNFFDGTSLSHDTIPSAYAVRLYAEAHIFDTVDAHDASAISNIPSGNISSTDVQSALNELDSDKYDKTGGTISGDVTISGDLTVNGTTTSVNSNTLDVTDSNITVNNGGDQASADLNNAGITVEMSDAPDALIGYDSTLASKFNIGEIGDLEEILTSGHTQDISNKTVLDGLTFDELSVTPSTPATNKQMIYPKDNGKWYSLDDTGTETELGSGAGGFVKVDYHDPLSSVLPTGTSVTIDGEVAANGDRVLFTNLSVGNNKVYELSGVGVSLVWTQTLDFNNGTPEDGDTTIILSGQAFAEAIGKFNGTDWVFNDVVRYYSGADYWEQSSLKTSDILSSTTSSIFEVLISGSENCIVDYSILRGSTKETGLFIITSDGTNVTYNRHVANIGDVGVTLFADNNAGTLRFRYTSDSSGTGTIKYTLKRWSNASGGPGGVPSYSGATGGGSAGGNNTEVQFNSGGSLAGDSNFTWNGSNLKISNLEIRGTNSTVTIVNNQTTATTLFSVDGSLSKFVICDYSIERGTESRVGTLMICHNGTITSITDSMTDTGGVGIDQTSIPITATYSGGFILVQYTSDNTGFTGNFKYNLRKWL